MLNFWRKIDVIGFKSTVRNGLMNLPRQEYILPKYSAFYDKYANIAFTKNPEKYVRYTAAQVSALIDCFFDAAY